MCRPESVIQAQERGYNQATWLRGVGTAVFVPENFEPGYRYPVVVWLEASGEGFEARTWFPLISSRNALAISLQPPYTPRESWGTSPDDLWQALEYVSKSVAEVAEEVAVHPRRIFLAGRQDGAAMAADILCTEPERFAGAVLIDPTIDDAPIALDPQTGGRSSPVLVAMANETEVQRLQRRHRTELEIESVSGLSKSALARSIDRWLMAQVGVCADFGEWR